MLMSGSVYGHSVSFDTACLVPTHLYSMPQIVYVLCQYSWHDCKVAVVVP